MTSPLPPSATPPNARVTPLLFGQTWTDPNGKECTADKDTVMLELLVNGEPVAQFLQSPENSIGLARMLVTAAGNIQARQVGDDGKPANPLERVQKFNHAWKGQQ
ncbi:membrane protein [Arthrobacter phage BruhMoment]|nr:membrane protein [Arthrobacter phage BruhMoment]